MYSGLDGRMGTDLAAVFPRCGDGFFGPASQAESVIGGGRAALDA